MIKSQRRKRSSVSLLTWNTAGRSGRIREQMDFILSIAPNLVALQEVRVNSIDIWAELLMAAGYENVSSIQARGGGTVFKGPRRYCQLTASSQHSLTPNDRNIDVPWPERVQSVLAENHGLNIEILNVHIPPGSSNGWIKIETFEGLSEALKEESNHPTILCGDFNSPNIEYPDGRVQVFRERIDGAGNIVPMKHRGQPPGRWSAAERAVICDLGRYGYVDAFRSIHGYGKSAHSWYLPQKPSVGRRFDHIFCRGLKPKTCDYIHTCRTDGLSDHSALLAQFELD
jgi:exonuclease III